MANKSFDKLETSFPQEVNNEKDIRVPASPIKLNTVDSGVVGNKRGPRLGEHSTEILKEYGYSDARIAEMLKSGATSQYHNRLRRFKNG